MELTSWLLLVLVIGESSGSPTRVPKLYLSSGIVSIIHIKLYKDEYVTTVTLSNIHLDFKGV